MRFLAEFHTQLAEIAALIDFVTDTIVKAENQEMALESALKAITMITAVIKYLNDADRDLLRSYFITQSGLALSSQSQDEYLSRTSESMYFTNQIVLLRDKVE